MDSAPQTEVLVAIMNDPLDLLRARDELWYRIPVSSADKWLRERWPPKWLAFYQTKIFADERYAVNYFAKVLDIETVYRHQLFPDNPIDETSYRRYHKLILGPLERCPQPIFSRRLRRIVFIPTTWQKFVNAVEINDLYDESPLEDRLWAEFKRRHIPAERQEFVMIEKRNYALDFAIYCAAGNIDVEADGDTWHANPEGAARDRPRDNDLATLGWHVLRFDGHDINERMENYCLKTVSENINRLGGVDEGGVLPRKISLPGSDGLRQLTLFDEPKHSE